MPYIKDIDRKKFDKILTEASGSLPEATAGELNYLVTSLIHLYLMSPELDKRGYQRYNDVIGVLEGAKLELYRREVAEYEDKKISENGDLESRSIL